MVRGARKKKHSGKTPSLPILQTIYSPTSLQRYGMEGDDEEQEGQNQVGSFKWASADSSGLATSENNVSSNTEERPVSTDHRGAATTTVEILPMGRQTDSLERASTALADTSRPVRFGADGPPRRFDFVPMSRVISSADSGQLVPSESGTPPSSAIPRLKLYPEEGHTRPFKFIPMARDASRFSKPADSHAPVGDASTMMGSPTTSVEFKQAHLPSLNSESTSETYVAEEGAANSSGTALMRPASTFVPMSRFRPSADISSNSERTIEPAVHSDGQQPSKAGRSNYFVPMSRDRVTAKPPRSIRSDDRPESTAVGLAFNYLPMSRMSKSPKTAIRNLPSPIGSSLSTSGLPAFESMPSAAQDKASTHSIPPVQEPSVLLRNVRGASPAPPHFVRMSRVVDDAVPVELAESAGQQFDTSSSAEPVSKYVGPQPASDVKGSSLVSSIEEIIAMDRSYFRKPSHKSPYPKTDYNTRVVYEREVYWGSDLKPDVTFGAEPIDMEKGTSRPPSFPPPIKFLHTEQELVAMHEELIAMSNSDDYLCTASDAMRVRQKQAFMEMREAHCLGVIVNDCQQLKKDLVEAEFELDNLKF